MKTIYYSLTFLGTIEVSDDATYEEIKSAIANDYYDAGFDIDNMNDIEYTEA